MNQEHPAIPDLRRLAQFVAVADSGTLAAAADQLFITQQALSAALRQLERELDVALFDRTRRRLALTPAGEDLLRGARPLLTGARQLASTVRESAAGMGVTFRIGHSPALSGTEVFHLIEPTVHTFPDVSVIVRPVFPSRFRDELLAGDLDLVLRRGAHTPDDLTSTIVDYHPLNLAMQAEHPLAQSNSITVADLSSTPIMIWAPERASFYTDFLIAYCRRAGIEPHVRINRVQGTPPTTAVLVDPQVCAFVTDPPGQLHGGRVLVRAFDDDPPLAPVQALWPPHTTSTFRTHLLSRSPTES